MPNNRIHVPDISLFNRDVALVPTAQLKLPDEHSETFGTVGRLELLERFEPSRVEHLNR